MALLLIVFVVTIIGKEMCFPVGAATVGALPRRPSPLRMAGEAGSTGDGAPPREGCLLTISGRATGSALQRQSPWLLGGRVLTRSA